MKRYAIALVMLTACAAHAEPPKLKLTEAPPRRDPIAVLNVPVPVAVVCTLTPEGDKLTYARGPAYAAMSCGEYGRELQKIEARYGAGATFVQACALAEPCFAAKAEEARP